MKTFEVTLTIHRQVLMEGIDAADVKQCMRNRYSYEIGKNDCEIVAVEVKIDPNDKRHVIKA